MKNKTFYQFEVDSKSDKRIDQIIASLLPEYSRSRIKSWINNNNITLNDSPCLPKDKIKNKSIIKIKILENEEVDIVAQDIPIQVLKEEKDFIIINKISGMVMHIAPGNYTDTLQNSILYHFPELKKVPRAGIVHRLDKGTSGIIIIARNLISHNYFIKQFKKKLIEKKYLALASGNFPFNQTISEKIGRHKINRKKMTVTKYGKEAISKIYINKKLNNSTLLDIDLITGRTHQIRVHLSHLGYPIIGDKQYGFKKNIYKKNQKLYDFLNKYENLALHARYLCFKEPKNEKIIKINSNPPKSFDTIEELLR